MSAEKNCPMIFVTGTDTGVGKTIVTAALARFLANKGLTVGVMKPVETGVDNLDEMGRDALLLKRAAVSSDPADLIAPYRFKEPLAPCQAATRAGETIEINTIHKALEQLLPGKDIILIEGAGGLMVPITGGYLMADMAREFGLTCLLVTRPGLGTLNHTQLTTFAANNMGLDLAGFMINGMPEEPGPAEAGAPHLLASLASATPLGVLPHLSGSEEEIIDTLADEIGRLDTLPWLLNSLGLSGHPAFRRR